MWAVLVPGGFYFLAYYPHTGIGEIWFVSFGLVLIWLIRMQFKVEIGIYHTKDNQQKIIVQKRRWIIFHNKIFCRLFGFIFKKLSCCILVKKNLVDVAVKQLEINITEGEDLSNLLIINRVRNENNDDGMRYVTWSVELYVHGTDSNNHKKSSKTRVFVSRDIDKATDLVNSMKSHISTNPQSNFIHYMDFSSV